MKGKKQSAVLIVEDEPASLNLLASYFMAENYLVYKANSSDQAEKLFSEKVIDIILMDIKIPGKTGLELTREFRSRSGVGIILVTQKNDDIDKIVGLELGADDYVTKPFDFAELEARCRAVLRRQVGAAQNRLEFAGVISDPQEATLIANDNIQNLRNRELRLVEIFFAAPAQIFSKNHLIDRLFSLSEDVSENAIEVYVGRLRKKLAGTRAEIETVRSLGYRLVARP